MDGQNCLVAHAADHADPFDAPYASPMACDRPSLYGKPND
jgi:hypothetical protein